VNYVKAFLLAREAEGLSRKTLEGYASNLSMFEDWLGEQAHAPSEWTPNTIRAYFVYLRERGSKRGGKLAPHSVRAHAVVIKAFCRWLFEEEIAAKNIAERISAPKIPTLVKEPFTTAELRLLLTTTKADKRNGLRDHAMLLFMLDTGCRANEVVGLKEAEILWNQRLAKVYGKGSKERVVFFSVETAQAMLRYQRRSKDCACFFCSEEGKPMTPSGLLQIMKRLGNRANVSNVHPHRFRHTFALTFLRSGGNVLVLQRILGHTTLAMTQRYVAMVSDDLQREHVAHSPVQFLLK
jgi:site-specific recombinase XerD